MWHGGSYIIVLYMHVIGTQVACKDLRFPDARNYLRPNKTTFEIVKKKNAPSFTNTIHKERSTERWLMLNQLERLNHTKQPLNITGSTKF